MEHTQAFSRTRRWTITLVTIGIFAASYFGRESLLELSNFPAAGEAPWWIRSLWSWATFLVPALLAGALLFRTAIFSALGLIANPATGLLVGLLGTLPMLLALVLWNDWSPGDAWFRNAIHGALMPGVIEEILFRGMLFGFLYRFAGWRFLPAALLGALIFGSAHLSQSSDPMQALGIFAVTGLGGVWFAWLYAAWNNNLWVPIAFHGLMNLYWGLFSVADNALGSGAANSSRLVVIALSVVISIVAAKRAGRRLPAILGHVREKT